MIACEQQNSNKNKGLYVLNRWWTSNGAAAMIAIYMEMIRFSCNVNKKTQNES